MVNSKSSRGQHNTGWLAFSLLTDTIQPDLLATVENLRKPVIKLEEALSCRLKKCFQIQILVHSKSSRGQHLSSRLALRPGMNSRQPDLKFRDERF